MPLPVPRPPLDRAALERVLARAAELQGQSPTTDETAGALTDEQVLELGKEVGLSPEALRQAIAEERGRVTIPEASGLGGMWFGPDVLSSTRVVPGSPASVMAAVDATLRGELAFDVKRRFPDRMVWEPRRTFVDVMGLQFARSREGMQLRIAHDVAVSVVAVDGQRTHARVDVSLETARGSAVRKSLTVLGFATVVGLVLGVAGVTPFVLVPLITIGTLAGLFGARATHRSEAMRLATAVEQLLDRLEFGPAHHAKRGLVDKLLG